MLHVQRSVAWIRLPELVADCHWPAPHLYSRHLKVIHHTPSHVPESFKFVLHTFIMRRRHDSLPGEALTLLPKSRTSPLLLISDRDIIPEFEDRIWLALIVLSILILVTLHVRLRRMPLPSIPWVHLDPKKWFSKLQARTWTTVNYEAALKEAYETVWHIFVSQLMLIGFSTRRTTSHAFYLVLMAIQSSCHRQLYSGSSISQILRLAQMKARRMCCKQRIAFLCPRSWIERFISVSIIITAWSIFDTNDTGCYQRRADPAGVQRN